MSDNPGERIDIPAQLRGETPTHWYVDTEATWGAVWVSKSIADFANGAITIPRHVAKSMGLIEEATSPGLER